MNMLMILYFPIYILKGQKNNTTETVERERTTEIEPVERESVVDQNLP